jgi:hypothetical protein
MPKTLKTFASGHGAGPLVFAKRRDMKGLPGSMPAGGHGAGEGFPKIFGMELAAWEDFKDFRQRKTSHAAGSMPASGHGAGGLKKIL